MKRIALVLLLAGAAAADECAECKTPKTCEKHALGDKSAAARFQDEYANMDAGVRTQALETLGNAFAEHANCRSPLAGQLFGAVLKDKDPAVRARAAELLGTYADPAEACRLLGKDIEPMVKKLAKEPKGEKEETAWLADFDTLTGIARGLAATGSVQAGAQFAKILSSTRLKVLSMACEHCHKIKSRDTVDALLEAMDRVRNTAANPDRDKAYLSVMTCWEKLTSSGVRNPTPGDVADNSRFILDCRKWWKANKDNWK